MKFVYQASFMTLVSLSCRVCGFAIHAPILGLDSATNDSRIFSHPKRQDNDNDPTITDNDTRTKRILLPMQFLTSSLLFIETPLPAHAGIGTVVPFEETRREKFKGSIRNYVVVLRLNSTLNKLGYQKRNAVVATLKSSDDLSVDIARNFGRGGQVVSLADDSSSSSFADYIQSCQGKKALVLYGQDVSISPEGDVSEIQGKDLKSSEKLLMDALASKGISNVTLIGGIVIHRAKSGTAKDTGEDCFLPMAITSVKDGVTTDLFERVFGDLQTPRQSVDLG